MDIRDPNRSEMIMVVCSIYLAVAHQTAVVETIGVLQLDGIAKPKKAK